MTFADDTLEQVYAGLGLTNATEEQKCQHLDQINAALDALNAQNTMNVKTTGTINERLVELALKARTPDSWYHLRRGRYEWLGDFGINAYPLSVVVSVKSFKAKERLLVSGTGTLYAPTIGWGRFDDPAEFGLERLKTYLFRGFIAIYMPTSTIGQLTPAARQLQNYYGNRFIRSINSFGDDLAAALIPPAQMGGASLIETASF
ncbi:hypothetical protein [Thalassobium sp. R2A62]|uniref:hypothetical protein n=1 Tax=Thalassobium sp. R2A62 TaxID=633131 RepID=UPI0001B1D69C|nr:hypothetical protein [Thalassobium sp. R2A62]EET49617.1 hypothetical protein TR2A62_2258 [Thalassobium sp. R2A62]